MKKILLVEDTAPLAEELADILTLAGYKVTLAENGVRGLALLPHTHPHAIITDLIMPVMDGFEFIQRIRNMKMFMDIPILVLSAKTSPADKERANKVGATAFINKPCKIPELISMVELLISNRAK